MPNIDTRKSTICLNMIVKNEFNIIKRCLESVIPHIDTWVISDTGSTDGTQKLIREVMKDIPGELIERKWQNFGVNRQEVIEASKDRADYILTIDADEWLEAENGFDFTKLTEDSYYIVKDQGDKRYWVRNIVKNGIGWHWKGVLHEYLECTDAKTYADIENAVIQARQEGARAHDPETYRKDAALLTKALIDEPNNTRYQFYLAQSWRDAGDYEKAILHYDRRTKMVGWEEEIFYSKYQIAIIMEISGKKWEECLTAYLDAWQHAPQRAEPIHKIGIHYLKKEKWPLAWLFLNQAAKMPKPENLILFIEDPVYDYIAIFDAAKAAGHMGYIQEMTALNEKILQKENLPEEIINATKKNQAYFESTTHKEG